MLAVFRPAFLAILGPVLAALLAVFRTALLPVLSVLRTVLSSFLTIFRSSLLRGTDAALIDLLLNFQRGFVDNRGGFRRTDEHHGGQQGGSH